MKTEWQKRPLADICQFSNGLWKGEKPPFVNVGVIRNTNFTKDGALDDSDIAYLDVEAKKFEKRRLQFGDVILEKSGGGPKQPVGRVVLFDLAEGDFSFSNFTAALRVLDPNTLNFRFLHKFLHWTYLSGVTEGMQTHSTGIRNLDGDAYKAIEIAFPKLPEQKRIVGILDEAFDGIATAKANAEKNLQNARALFESHLQSVFSRHGDHWVQKTLGDVCHQITDGKHGDCEDEDRSGYYFLSAKDIKNGMPNWEGARQITRRDFEETHRRTNLEPGDILITNAGTIGRMAIAPVDDRTTRTTFQKSVAILKPIKTKIDSKFAFHCLSSGLARFVKLSSGTAQKNLLLRDLREYRFGLPQSLDEQRAIGQEIDHLSLNTQRLESIYQQKLAALEALKKSLLHQAFSGQL